MTNVTLFNEKTIGSETNNYDTSSKPQGIGLDENASVSRGELHNSSEGVIDSANITYESLWLI